MGFSIKVELQGELNECVIFMYTTPHPHSLLSIVSHIIIGGGLLKRPQSLYNSQVARPLILTQDLVVKRSISIFDLKLLIFDIGNL